MNILKKYTSLIGCTVLLCSNITYAQDHQSDVWLDKQLPEISIEDAQKLMQSGKISALQLSQWYLKRIQQIDQHGPKLNAVIEINPEALDIAKKLDQERSNKGPRSAMHGIPVLLKDNIDTGDQMQTTAGSLALLDSPARNDAFIVKQLRKAGAVILGKTNLSEWANFRSNNSSSGWSSRGGQTKNPYYLKRNPCGSSSGSAVAVSANLSIVAIGTETDGSIICPSNANGIVGIKPTLGLVSRSGIIPIAHSQDTAGPMARTVADAAGLLNAITGIDQNDSITREQKGNTHKDYTKFLKKDGLKGIRIGVARNYFGFDERVDAIMETSIKQLKKLGAIIIDPANINKARDYGKAEYEVLLYEFKADLNLYLKQRNHRNIKNLQDIIDFNIAHKDKTMPYFGQEILTLSQTKGSLNDRTYLKALKRTKRLSREKGLDAAFKKHQIDAIIAPSGGPAWTTDLVNGDHFSGSSSSAAAVSGYPSITVPAGFIHGLPVGISFIGLAYQEGKLIQYAYAFEQASRVRKTPEFLKNIINHEGH